MEHGAGASADMSSTFTKDVKFEVPDGNIKAASISPSGRDVVLASKSGFYIIDLDSPYSLPRHIIYRTNWDVADVQWSPFASHAGRIATTANQKAIVLNLEMKQVSPTVAPIEHTLHAHSRAITDINFSAHNPDILATCAVDSFVFTWDLRVKPYTSAFRPVHSVADFEAGATQVKWNRKSEFYIASAHDKYLHIWDTRKGAVPVSTITAHGTKIYGIDWNRTNTHKIITCSLDKTIKFWDNVGIDANICNPTRVIESIHPVWRARHTPFPNGVLAMPQRGSSALNLYNQSPGQLSPGGITEPVHTFQAHKEDARVQEFLWRSRGSTDDGFDNREFQLVSWGTDCDLHLYKVTSELLRDAVGFEKGGPITEKPSTTRKGAKYISFREPPEKPTLTDRPRHGQAPGTSQPGALSTLLQQSAPHAHVSASPYPETGPPRTTMTAGSIRNQGFGRRGASSFTWVKGVTVGERPTGNHTEQHAWTTKTDLKDEVEHVGEKYPKVVFEKINIEERRIQVLFQGPWGAFSKTNDPNSPRKLAFLRLTVDFPPGYPPQPGPIPKEVAEHPEEAEAIEVHFHKTTAAIDDHTFQQLKDGVKQIAEHRAGAGRDALEAVICYCLGERSLEDSLVLTKHTQEEQAQTEANNNESSSSDEDDDAVDDDPEHRTHDALNSSLANANVPLPIQCATNFSGGSGHLVLARVPTRTATPTELTSILRLGKLGQQTLTRDEIFESFGRLKFPHGYDSGSPTSSTASWEFASSASSSSGSGEDAVGRVPGFQPPLAWQNPALRLHSKTSHPSSIAGQSKVTRPKSVVTILTSGLEDLIPSKRCLAEEYHIFGQGPQVCSHNAEAARRFGLHDLADIWDFCSLILTNQVPLEILPQQYRRDQILVLARRALVRIRRKDSGLDLQFDETDTVNNPTLKGRVKWGNHPVVTWLVPALFDHFERLADTQMLAMLSCIFSEPASREGVSSAMAKMDPSELPMSMAAPAFSLDYFPSADVAWSLYKPAISMPSLQSSTRLAAPSHEWQRLTKALDTHGSHGSSNGPWGSDTMPSEPVTPYSTGNTPPNMSRTSTARSTVAHTPYSTSPEQSSHLAKKPQQGNFASAFASLSRPFAAISSSPPVKNLTRSEADLSTSAPASNVTWGTTTFYSGGSSAERAGTPRAGSSKRASFGQSDRLNIDYYSDSDSEYEESGPSFDGISDWGVPTARGSDEDNSIRVILKNQDQFDDEGSLSAPLLDMSKDWLYRAWREQYADMLGRWGLISQRAEILKFNGLTSYFPVDSESTSKASSMRLGARTNGTNTPLPLSRTPSMMLAPAGTPQYRRSPLASPQNFSFNPEAPDFQPGTSLEKVNSTLLAPPPDIFVPTEQYLRLSIPTPLQPDLDAGFFEGAATATGASTPSHSKSAHSRLRPSLSRAITMTKHPSLAGIPMPVYLKRHADKGKKEPVYSCSICWIRVSGRFFLCPSCGHVAHFDCMDTGPTGSGFADEGLGILHIHGHQGWEEGECVVGCGCGCGILDDDTGFTDAAPHAHFLRSPSARDINSKSPVTRSVHYMHEGGGSPEDYFRRWEDSGGWNQITEGEGTGTGSPYTPGFEGGYGHDDEEEREDRRAIAAMAATAFSPKMGEKKGRVKELRKGIKRAQTTR